MRIHTTTTSAVTRLRQRAKACCGPLLVLAVIVAAGCTRIHKRKFDGMIHFRNCGHVAVTPGEGSVAIGCNCDKPLIVDSLDAKSGKRLRTIYCDGKIR